MRSNERLLQRIKLKKHDISPQNPERYGIMINGLFVWM